MDELTPYLPSRDLQQLVCSYSCPNPYKVFFFIRYFSLFRKYCRGPLIELIRMAEKDAERNNKYKYIGDGLSNTIHTITGPTTARMFLQLS